MKTAMCISSIVVAAFTISAFATPVIASNGSSVSVSYKDLDLANAAGARELRARVNHAASKVCAEDRSGDCVQSALASAEPQVALALASGASRSRGDSIAVSAH